MNMVRIILKGKNLPKELWGEVVSTTTYLLNMCPKKKLEKVTLEEARSGFKPNLNHLIFFGFVAYRHVPGQLRKKLEDKGEVVILVWHHSTGGYKLFDVENMRIMINRDVVVDELKQVEQLLIVHKQSLTGYMQSLIGYQKIIIGYKFEIPDSAETGSVE